MNAAEFVAKWRKSELTERSAAQQHFLDLCELVGHPKPAEADPTGEWFTFEKGAAKHGGGDGWADAWKRGFFAFEYKGKKKNLEKAYDQLLLYRADLESPPLLVVCDLDRIIIRTNFTATKVTAYEIPLKELGSARNLEILRAVFHEPEKLKPGTTSAAITQEAARRVAEVAQALRGRGLDPREVAHFLDRIVFCLFAEDIRLLPEMVFTRLVERGRQDPELFRRFVGELFERMSTGGFFGLEPIRYFNGSLFDGTPVLDLTAEEISAVHRASLLDWSAVDPSIFGTLFERGLDPAKRSQLGAHYTSREDIETLVDPVVMQPLRREWDTVRASFDLKLVDAAATLQRIAELEATTTPGAHRTQRQIDSFRKQVGNIKRKSAQLRQEAEALAHGFLTRLASVRVLDPACGSGNFLYVTLQKLKDLEKEVIVYAMEQGFPTFLPGVGPWQLYGIEVNPYAFDLAQMSVWIGYLQWIRANGFGVGEDPILRPLTENFRCMDAILDLSDPEHPREPEWPEVDFIVGNPPFLGEKRHRTELGDAYVHQLRELYAGRVGGSSDLCCYWFERARGEIAAGRLRRGGLLATNSIRQASNRDVLERIKATGAIFWAESDRTWVQDGAAVRVSMVGFDNGTEEARILDGVGVAEINAALQGNLDVTLARRLSANSGLAFIGDCKKGQFDIPFAVAWEMLSAGGNPNGRPNSDVIVPSQHAGDLVGRGRDVWIIDFGIGRTEDASSKYQAPFEYVKEHVKPARDAVRNSAERLRWWLHARPAPDMRAAVGPRVRYLATPNVSKHRLFSWLEWPVLPAHKLIVFATNEDWFLGVVSTP
ncbi:MAG: class I SAM-dependent DNA methyltransferase [Actinomycetota bacterium]